MKCAVVYYSLDGNTKAAASEIAAVKVADVFELKERKGKRKGGLGFMKCAFQAAVKARSRLKDDFHSEMAGYDELYIGTPVWAGGSTPAVNAFVRKTDFKGKAVHLFFLCASPEADYMPKGADYLGRAVKKGGGTVKKVHVWHGGAPGKPADPGEIAKQAREALKI